MFFANPVPSFSAIAVLSAEGATRFGLVRAAFALVGLVLCIPLAGIMLLLLPAFAAARTLANSSITLRASISATLLAIPVALSWWLAQRHRRGGRFAGRCVLWLQIVCGLLAVASLLYPLRSNTFVGTFPSSTDVVASSRRPDPLPQQPPSSVSWQQYHTHCHQPAWEKSSVAVTQLACASLTGTSISWDGYVTEVKVVEMSNPVSSVLQFLPSYISSVLSCLVGQQVPADCSDKENTLGEQHCQLLHVLSQSCHLERYSSCTMSVGVKMKSGALWGLDAEVILLAEHAFKNFTVALKPGDRIWFQGALMSYGLGGPKPQVQLEQIGCLGCHKTDLMPQRKSSMFALSLPSVSDTIQAIIQSVVNLVFGPLVRFK